MDYWNDSDKAIKRRTKNSKAPKGSVKKFESKNCSVCNVEFVPKGTRSSLCPECKLNQWVDDIMYGVDKSEGQFDE